MNIALNEMKKARTSNIPDYNATERDVPFHFASRRSCRSETTSMITLLEKHQSTTLQHTGDTENKCYKKNTLDNFKVYNLTSTLQYFS